MKTEVLLEHLEAAAEALAVKVSYETLGVGGLSTAAGHGGLCRVKGQYRVIIDKRATPAERVATLASSLSRFDTAELALKDAVRDTLMLYSTKRAS